MNNMYVLYVVTEGRRAHAKFAFLRFCGFYGKAVPQHIETRTLNMTHKWKNVRWRQHYVHASSRFAACDVGYVLLRTSLFALTFHRITYIIQLELRMDGSNFSP